MATLIWGSIAIVVGLHGVIFRRRLSERANADRVRQGDFVRRTTQSAFFFGFGGAVILGLGAALLVGGLTGLLR